MGKNLRKVVQLIQNSLVGLDYPCSLDSSLFFAGFLADWPCKDADFTIQNREVSWFHSDVILKSHNPSKTVFWAGIDPATPLFFLRGKLLFCFILGVLPWKICGSNNPNVWCLLVRKRCESDKCWFSQEKTRFQGIEFDMNQQTMDGAPPDVIRCLIPINYRYSPHKPLIYNLFAPT